MYFHYRALIGARESSARNRLNSLPCPVKAARYRKRAAEARLVRRADRTRRTSRRLSPRVGWRRVDIRVAAVRGCARWAARRRAWGTRSAYKTVCGVVALCEVDPGGRAALSGCTVLPRCARSISRLSGRAVRPDEVPLGERRDKIFSHLIQSLTRKHGCQIVGGKVSDFEP